jgi:small conductance mechanosensitive channel
MDLEGPWNAAMRAVAALAASYGLRTIGAIVILIAGWMVSRMVHSAVVKVSRRAPHVDRTVALFLANGARYAVLVFTIIAVLTTFGIETTSFVAMLGAIGLAIGLALQGTLSNLAAGIMLVVFRPFHVGDRVEVLTAAGTICEVNLFYTELDADGGGRVVVPNGKLWGEIVRVPNKG